MYYIFLACIEIYIYKKIVFSSLFNLKLWKKNCNNENTPCRYMTICFGEMSLEVQFQKKQHLWHLLPTIQLKVLYIIFQSAVTVMKCFTRTMFSRSLVNKKNFALIWQVVFMFDHWREKLWATIILSNFVNKPLRNSYWPSVFGKCLSLVKI